MSSTQEQSHLGNRIWAAGMFLARDPSPIQLTPKRFETKTRSSNLGMRIDRCFIDDGFPNILNRIDLSLPWRDIREPQTLEHLTSLANVGQGFDVALFKQEADFYNGDGTNTTFFLQRRVIGPTFLGALPGSFTAYPDYPLKATHYSAQYGTVGATGTDYTTVVYKTTSSIELTAPASGEIWIEESGHALGNLLVSKVRVNPAPASGSDTLRIIYLPLMRMLLDSDAGRSFEAALAMSRSFRFSEQ